MCRTTRRPLGQISSVRAARVFFDACDGESKISALKMQKLVYIAHENHIASTGKPFISDRVEAWTNGPVFPALNQYIGNSRDDIVTEACLPANNDDVLDPKIKKYIQETWDRLKKRTGVGLSNDTHAEETPWHMAMNPKRSFFQKLIGWKPKHPVINERLIKRHLRKSKAWG